MTIWKSDSLMTDLIVSTLFSLVEKNALRSQLGLGNDSNFGSVRVSIVFGKECLVRSLPIIRSAHINLVWSHDYRVTAAPKFQ